MEIEYFLTAAKEYVEHRIHEDDFKPIWRIWWVLPQHRYNRASLYIDTTYHPELLAVHMFKHHITDMHEISIDP